MASISSKIRNGFAGLFSAAAAFVTTTAVASDIPAWVDPAEQSILDGADRQVQKRKPDYYTVGFAVPTSEPRGMDTTYVQPPKECRVVVAGVKEANGGVREAGFVICSRDSGVPQFIRDNRTVVEIETYRRERYRYERSPGCRNGRWGDVDRPVFSFFGHTDRYGNWSPPGFYILHGNNQRVFCP